MIYAFSFTDKRDVELSNFMCETLIKNCPQLHSINVVRTDKMGYGNGAGWEASMMKLEALKSIAWKVKDDDYILSVDSDVVFCSPEVFSFIHTYGIIGIMDQNPKRRSAIGGVTHMSGCSIYVRGDIAKKMSALDNLDRIRKDFKHYAITENEDIVLSYLAQLCGAEPFDFPPHLHGGNFEQDVQSGELKSFYHLNYVCKSFLGEPTEGKWNIPSVLKMKGVNL